MFEWWAKVSKRERRLFSLTAILIALSVGYFVYVQAMDRIAALDARIAGLEADLLFYNEQMALLDEVDRAYQAVASEHSSEWTQEEIHDRLRREIARLSLANPPAPGAEVSMTGGGQRLVDIRQMPQGTLSMGEEGYREYQITIRTQPTSIQNIAQFLERLHRSPQALRIASLDLTRAHDANAIGAQINIIRSVVDTEKAGGPEFVVDPARNWILNSGFEDWSGGTNPDAWTVVNAAATADARAASEGDRGARVKASQAGAQLFQTVELIGGAEFELSFSVQTSGNVSVRAYDESVGEFVGQPVQIDATPTVKRYKMRLRAPGISGDAVTLRAPVFVLEESGTEIALDDVTLNQVSA